MTAASQQAAPTVDAFTSSAEHRPDGFDLDRLVHPLSPQDFLDRYWQQRPVHLRGWPDRLAGLFDLDDLHDLLMGPRGADLEIRVSRDHVGDDGGADRHVAIVPDEVVEHLRAGSSVCVDAIDRAVPRLRAVAATLQRRVGHVGPVSVKCYLSTDAHGFNTHYDAHVVTTLQLEGTKRWLVSSSPGVAFPLHNAFVDADGLVHHTGRTPSSLRPWEAAVVRPDDLYEVVLEPGDVLCLPAGTWHDAKASGHSLALNVSFEPIDLLDVFVRAARTILLDDPRWRAGLSARTLEADLVGATDDLRAVLASPAFTTEVRAIAESTRRGQDDGRDRDDRRDRDDPRGRTVGLPVREAAARRTGNVDRGHAGSGPAALQCVLGVVDVERTTRWYTDVLGLRVVRSIPEYGWVELAGAVDGVTIGLTEDRSASVPGGALLDFRVEDLDDLLARLASADDGSGTPIGEDDVRDVHGVGRFVRARDPDDNLVMFYQAHQEVGQP